MPGYTTKHFDSTVISQPALNYNNAKEKMGQELFFTFLCEERFDKGVGVEFGDVFGFFAEADEFDGDV